MIRLVALACGLMCGAGILISGLYDPGLVHGRWAEKGGLATLGVVFLTVIVIAALLTAGLRARGGPLLGGDAEALPDWSGAKALASALVFGIGWGLSGYFPLVALVGAGALSPGAAIFLASALFGMILTDIVSGKRKLGGGRRGTFG